MTCLCDFYHIQINWNYLQTESHLGVEVVFLYLQSLFISQVELTKDKYTSTGLLFSFIAITPF